MSKKLLDSHFAVEEISCRCGCGLTPTVAALVALEAARLAVGQPFIISSGARCEKYNKEVGGAEFSRHAPPYLNAFDITCSDNVMRFLIIEAALRRGFNGIGVAKNFVHIDMRPLSEGRVWLY